MRFGKQYRCIFLIILISLQTKQFQFGKILKKIALINDLNGL